MASIRALPADVAAKIKSSVVISSLSSVLTGLLENSLDAGANNIDIRVDFARASCSVEDDGYGIAPFNFYEDGGLDTSKLDEDYGSRTCNGVFLSSVASLSVLTLISCHHKFDSTNAIMFHHSRPVARLTPAPAHMSLNNRNHGTRVIVQDLFGNLPVRVKQRPTGDEGSRVRDKQWKDLCRSVVAVLLANTKQRTSLTLKGENSSQTLKIRWSGHYSLSGDPEAPSRRSSSFNTDAIQNILVQSGYIDLASWSHWVRTSARTLSLTIRAIISTEAAPSKDIQFVCIGSQVIDSNHGFNIIYDEVNRIFAQSSFGVREEPISASGTQAENYSPSRYHKLTGRQLRGGGKGVDRWPMFFIRIETTGKSGPGKVALDIDDRGQLSSILNVLDAMISSFLTQNNFRPRKRRKRKDLADEEASTDILNPNLEATAQHAMKTSNMMEHRPKKFGSKPIKTRHIGDLEGSVAFPHLSRDGKVRRESEYFSGWGRIKYGPQQNNPTTSTHNKLPTQSAHLKVAMQETNTDSSPVLEAELDKETMLAEEDSGNLTSWIDPISKERILIDKRTGFVKDPKKNERRRSMSGIESNVNLETFHRNRLTLNRTKSDPKIGPVSREWANALLAEWKNPVFERTEEPIRQITAYELNPESYRRMATSEDRDSAFVFSSGQRRLTKDELRNCEVISQVDRKFILAKVQSDSDMLLLIDQHAADERIRVESLLSDLCLPVNGGEGASGAATKVASVALPSPVEFELKSKEHIVFRNHQAYFADWGIAFKLRRSPAPSASGPAPFKHFVTVTALPPTIAERCRADPHHLVDFLRSTAWSQEQASLSRSKPQSVQSEIAPSSPHWIRRIHDCPKGLLDMINSRACRSSIMFNDELSLDECRDLVRKLADCHFPFQCAHGRPSLAPLVSLGELERDATRPSGTERREHSGSGAGQSDFASKWLAWDKARSS